MVNRLWMYKSLYLLMYLSTCWWVLWGIFLHDFWGCWAHTLSVTCLGCWPQTSSFEHLGWPGSIYTFMNIITQDDLSYLIICWFRHNFTGFFRRLDTFQICFCFWFLAAYLFLDTLRLTWKMCGVCVCVCSCVKACK